MDLTATAAGLLEAVPANRLFGIRVTRASPQGGEVELEVAPEHVNVIGSLHASGLVALLDAGGLAAVLGLAPAPEAVPRLSALGAQAQVRFLAPARGTLTARCVLDEAAADELESLYAGRAERCRLTTHAQVLDQAGREVCAGSFDWRLRRTASRGLT